ncbi:bacterial regulatory protein, crp family protein [Asticcacaulis biprosthecium C19]|uniref:Bacterial regulatory protein, crp family protein n=1 Tax=Asticcacaulis biprosthecium C19 TaxID=715226 RepID=F4QS67_9CAUL|nr:helix-turn-helix domain-containing protein [Asticcacaulis biprosthecium]EGF89587.1 bacterial regulatory protein, crp family protein [Asticcacaulis biprosthecium C19]
MDTQHTAIVQKALKCDRAVAELFLSRTRAVRREARAVLHPDPGNADIGCILLDGLAHELAYGRNGQSLRLWQIRSGDLFGNILALAHEDSSAEVIAETWVDYARFSSTCLVDFMERHTCVAIAVTHLMLLRLEDTKSRILEESLLSATGRIHAELLRLASRDPDHVIRPAPVMAEIAVYVNSTRETVSRAVSALEKRGIVRRETDSLRIVAPHRLEELIR